MPNRLACVAILLFWTVAAGALFTRDILPNYLIGPPPDLRTISQAEDPGGPTKWSILSVDEGKSSSLRSVGQITTETKRKRDGWVRMTSQAWLDAGEWLRGSSLEAARSERIGILGACEIDASGNLQNFRVAVRDNEFQRDDWLVLEGRLKKDVLEVTSRCPMLPILNGSQSIPYHPRGIVQNSFGPLDRMPGLQVGQTWETQVVSPITGKIQTCRVQVVGTEHIIWGMSSVLTLKVVTKMAPISASTWVRPDGLVLRQEIPFPPRKLILERLPDDPAPPAKSAREGNRR
jgi:hypothetical protein